MARAQKSLRAYAKGVFRVESGLRAAAGFSAWNWAGAVQRIINEFLYSRFCRMKTRLPVIFLMAMAAMTSIHAQDAVHIQAAAEEVKQALQQSAPLPQSPGSLIVANQEVAKAIHLAVAGAIYGEARIQGQQPFIAVRSGEFWVVFGSLPGKQLGGTAVTVMRASNGEILRVSHGR